VHSSTIAGGRTGFSLQTRQQSLAIIGNLELDPGPALERVLRLLEDPNPKMRAQAAMELHCVLYRLGPELDRCLEALAPLQSDPDRFTAEQAQVALLFGEWLRNSRTGPDAVPTRQSVTPEMIVERLDGKHWVDMVRLWPALDLPMGIFTRPYTLDPGPFRVACFDLDIDGQGGMDAVVRIGDRNGIYWQFLIFLRRDAGWTLADCVVTNNQPGLDPEPRSVALEGAGTFLVIRKTTDYTKHERGLAADTWFRVTDRMTKLALYLPVAVQCAEPLVPMRTALPDRDLRTVFETGSDSRGPWVGYAIEAVYTAGLAPGTSWPAEVADVTPRHFELFSRSGQIRFRWSHQHERLENDATQSTWTIAELEGLRLDSPDEFVAHNSAELATVVSTGSKEAKEWVRLFLQRCTNTPECRRLRDLLAQSGRVSPGER
jgi:hypothetical protein